jgi:hypothetical protein
VVVVVLTVVVVVMFAVVVVVVMFGAAVEAGTVTLASVVLSPGVVVTVLPVDELLLEA